MAFVSEDSGEIQHLQIPGDAYPDPDSYSLAESIAKRYTYAGS